MNRSFYFPAIDGLRFIAFLMVFIYHLSPFRPTSFFNMTGWTGVHLFFLISGFLLSKLLTEEYKQSGSISLFKYFIRRILRIWPLYFLFLLIVSIASVSLTHHPFSLQRLFGNLFFYDNILTVANGFNPNLATGHLWSMSLEEQYYLVLPFFIPWLIKQNKKNIKGIIFAIFGLLLLTRLVLVIFHCNYTSIYVLPFSADCFVAGIALGIGVFDTWIKKIPTIFAWTLGIILLLLLYKLPPPMVMGPHIIWLYFVMAGAFFFIFIAVAYSNHRWLNQVFTNRPIRYLGKISFGLYVFHIAANYITAYFYSILKRPMDMGIFWISLSFTILLAIVSYELWEKQFLKMKDRFTVIKSGEI